MASVLDQENLIAGHQTTAANKPLNQNIRALQPKTPGNNLKTPFRVQNDENNFIQGGKAAKNTFVTPGLAPRTAPRAILGAKTANAKGQAFQTPAPTHKTQKLEKTAKKASSTRRTTKKKIYVEPEQSVENTAPEPEEENEPDFGYAPPSIVPLPDPPIDFDYDQTYAALRPENFNRGVGEVYFQSPKDEHGVSLSLRRVEEQDRESLQRDLQRILEEPDFYQSEPKDDEEEQIRAMSNHRLPVFELLGRSKVADPKIQESKISTLRSRSAAGALAQTQNPRVYSKEHARLPSAATAQTAASKQKRKSTFAPTPDTDTPLTYTTTLPPSKTTIGFPKARKPPSILPWSQNPPQTHSRSKGQHPESASNTSGVRSPETTVSPKKFVQIHGEPPVESDLWVQLKELEIRNRRRDDEEHDIEEPIFDFDETDVDQRLTMGFGDDDDFELTMD